MNLIEKMLGYVERTEQTDFIHYGYTEAEMEALMRCVQEKPEFALDAAFAYGQAKGIHLILAEDRKARKRLTKEEREYQRMIANVTKPLQALPAADALSCYIVAANAARLNEEKRHLVRAFVNGLQR